MTQTLRKTILSISFLTLVISLVQVAHATTLVLTINTDEYYNLGEDIVINGTLALNGSPVPDGLVSLQINDPRNEIFIIRTLTTGTTPTGPWSVELLEVIPCDSGGHQVSSFPRGGHAGFKVTIRNNDATSHNVTVALSVYDSNQIPFLTFVIYNQSIAGGVTDSRTTWPVDIPGNIAVGTAAVYGSALTRWPENGGIAWCPEESATFTITSGGGGMSIVTSTEQQTYTPSSATLGTFSTSFKTFPYGGILGNYTAYATSWYNLRLGSDQKTFEVLLIADVNQDGIVDMADISMVIDAFMTHPGEPGWNPRADINKDDIVDMADISIAIEEFGKYGQY